MCSYVANSAGETSGSRTRLGGGCAGGEHPRRRLQETGPFGPRARVGSV